MMLWTWIRVWILRWDFGLQVFGERGWKPRSGLKELLEAFAPRLYSSVLLFLTLSTLSFSAWADRDCTWEEINAFKQRQDFYEGMAILAEANVETFFVPVLRREGVHGDLFLRPMEGSGILQQTLGINMISSPSQSSFLVASDGPRVPREEMHPIEVEEMVYLRDQDLPGLSFVQLDRAILLERKLHKLLFSEHREELVSHQAMVFRELPPMEAYERIFKKYLESSLWWNSYLIDYALVMSALYRERALRPCADDSLGESKTLWSALGN